MRVVLLPVLLVLLRVIIVLRRVVIVLLHATPTVRRGFVHYGLATVVGNRITTVTHTTEEAAAKPCILYHLTPHSLSRNASKRVECSANLNSDPAISLNSPRM